MRTLDEERSPKGIGVAVQRLKAKEDSPGEVFLLLQLIKDGLPSSLMCRLTGDPSVQGG